MSFYNQPSMSSIDSIYRFSHVTRSSHADDAVVVAFLLEVMYHSLNEVVVVL